MTFQDWMKQVDQELAKRCGLTHLDLGDYPFRDAYDDECSPEEVALEILEEEGFPFE